MNVVTVGSSDTEKTGFVGELEHGALLSFGVIKSFDWIISWNSRIYTPNGIWWFNWSWYDIVIPISEFFLRNKK